MAASHGGYAASFEIPAPKGVYQAAGDTNVSLNYAYRAENMRTQQGLLASAYGTSRAFPALGGEIGTLTRFYRRTRPDDPEVFVAASGGALYTCTLGGDAWVQCVVYDSEGGVRETPFLADRWSCVTYETVLDGETTDVLILSNAYDGMVAIYGSDLQAREKPLAIGEQYADVHFAVLGRYAERIWGTGDQNHPDAVFYSRPYDPFTWTQDDQTPEMGGGMIRMPTWDGDEFITLSPFGGYLLAVKRRSVFEIRGTDPASFTVQQTYGTDGPVQGATVCVDGLGMLYLSEEGLGMYDGTALALLSRDALHETMRMRMPGRQEEAAACVCGHVYYLALCVRESEGDVLFENNTVIEYDLERGTFMIRRGLEVKAFYALGGKVFFTQARSPFEVLLYSDPQSGSYLGEPMRCLWETAWLDLGKGLVKRDFVLRFTAEADEKDFPLKLTLATERRQKTKTVMLRKGRGDYRVKIQLSGKRVKLRIESGARASAWRISGGVQVEYAFDEE